MSSNKRKRVSVIGSGAWGTALANLIAENAREVILFTHSHETAAEINSHHLNSKHLSNQNLNPRLKAIAGLSQDFLEQSHLIFIVTPSTFVKEILQQISKFNLKADTSFILCSKGLETNSLKFFSGVFSEIFPHNKFAILSGPNFASEVVASVPTVTTIASQHKQLFTAVNNLLANEHFSCFYSRDVITTEICGAVKNILAIGCGIIDGLALGENAKAALVNRGIAEIIALSQKISGKRAAPDLANPAAFGDIFLTCSTKKSRNNSLGYQISQGKTYQEITANSRSTFEGAIAAASITKLSRQLEINLALCETIHEILSQNFLPNQIKEKINRSILC